MIGLADFAGSERRPRRARRLRLVMPPVWSLALLAAAVGALSLWHALWIPSHFPVQQVQLQGPYTHVPRAAVRAAVRPLIHGNFFRMPLAPVRAALLRLPWVDAVSVTRAWPYRLVVQVTEQEPLARWAAGGWVNVRGDAIDLGTKDLPQGLPVFSGPAGSLSRVYARWRQWAPLAAQAGLPLMAVSASARGDWRVRTGSGITVVLGRQHETARLQRFLGLLKTISANQPQAKLERADLRYGNGFAVVWKPIAGSAKRVGHD